MTQKANSQGDGSMGHPGTPLKQEWIDLFHGKRLVMASVADAERLRELRRGQAEVQSRRRDAAREAAAFPQGSDHSDLREAAQAQLDALGTEMARLVAEIRQTEAELNEAAERQRMFLGTCGGGADSARGFLDRPQGAHASLPAVYPSVEVWTEDGDLILQLRANPPDAYPNQENLLDGLISFGELRTKRSLLLQTLSLWGELAGSLAGRVDRMIHHYEESEGIDLDLD